MGKYQYPALKTPLNGNKAVTKNLTNEIRYASAIMLDDRQNGDKSQSDGCPG